MSVLIDQLKAGLPDDETACQIIAEVVELEAKLEALTYIFDCTIPMCPTIPACASSRPSLIPLRQGLLLGCPNCGREWCIDSSLRKNKLRYEGTVTAERLERIRQEATNETPT